MGQLQLVAQKLDELRKGANVSEGLALARAPAKPSLISIQHLSAGLTPTGASTRFRYVFLMCFRTLARMSLSVFSSVMQLPRRVRLAAEALDDLAGLFENRVLSDVVEIPASGSSFLGELVGFLVQRRQRVAEENATSSFGGRFRPLKNAPGSRFR